MCYDKEYYERKQAKLAERYEAYMPFKAETRYKESGFQHLASPILTSEKPGEFQMYQWGLLPSWLKDPKKFDDHWNFTLNAVSEEVFNTASYKGVIMTKRCLIPVTAFYEHMDFNKKKYPHRIFVKSNEVFSLAGIYDECKNPNTGEIMKTYAILTCPANALMAKIHNLKQRMPVIVPKEREKEWLKSDLSKEEIQSFFVPYPDEDMDAHTVSKRLTSRTEDPNVVEVTKPFDYPELGQSQRELF